MQKVVKYSFFILFLVYGFGLQTPCVVGQAAFQLAPPLMRYDSAFFEKRCTVALRFEQAGTRIHYTTDGREPSEQSPLYRAPLVLTRQTTVKARVFGTGFLPSETVEATFFKRGLPIASLVCPPPHPTYSGSGPATLIDGAGGDASLHSKNWWGFQRDTLSIGIDLKRRQRVREVLVHALQNQGAWVFLPTKIEVWTSQKGRRAVLLGTGTWPADQPNAPTGRFALAVRCRKKPKTERLWLKIYGLPGLPEWHVGKGKMGWLFLEEVGIGGG